MSRSPRKVSSTGIYHVIIKGINAQKIFEDDEDCQVFLECLGAAKDLSGVCVLAYCLMGNHVHLVLEQGKETLGETMKRLSVRYVTWFNSKYARSGSLFQDRFKSQAVESYSYLITVLRYVFYNPVKAGLVAKNTEYQWSSCANIDSGSSIIDSKRLSDLCEIKDLLLAPSEAEQDTVFEVKGRLRLAITDAVAKENMGKTSGALSATAFQALDRAVQIKTVRHMLDIGASIRQVARVAGLSKGLVESWSRRKEQ